MTVKFRTGLQPGHTSRPFTEASLSDVEKERLCRDLLSEFGAANVRKMNHELIHSCVLPFGQHRNGDRNPSARLNYKKLTYICSSCGNSGGLLWFIGVCRGLTTPQAKSWLTKQVKTGGLEGEDGLAALLRYFDEIWSSEDSGPPPLPRMDARVLTPWLLIHPYLTEIRGIPEENLIRFSVGYDPVKDRIVVPHFWKGNLVGWQTRRLMNDGTPKWQSCVPMDTEILTSNGWKFQYELVKGEVVASVDRLGHLRYAPMLDCTKSFYSGPMVRIKTFCGEQLLTPNHRVFGWPERHVRNPEPVGGRGYHRVIDGLKRCPRCGDTKSLDEFRLYPGGQRCGYCQICANRQTTVADEVMSDWAASDLVSLPCGIGALNLPMAARTYEEGKGFGNPDIAALYGWALAEGSVSQRDGVRIYQTEMNFEYVEEIRKLFDRLGVPYSEYVRTQVSDGNWTTGFREDWVGREIIEHSFYMKACSLKDQMIADFARGKHNLAWSLTRLPRMELEALFEGFRKGDGGDWSPDNTSLGQKDKRILAWLQIVCCHLGYRSHLGKRDLYVCRRDSVQVHTRGKARDEWFSTVEFKDDVWCPRTVDGTWVARRGGSVFITGNSPDFPKSETIFNYNRDVAAVVVEAPLSVVSKCHVVEGLEATFGATIPDRQIRFLARHPKVTLWFDNDPAGWKATRQVGEALLNYAPVWVVDNPWAADPADMDDQTVVDLVAKAIPFSAWQEPKTLERWGTDVDG